MDAGHHPINDPGVILVSFGSRFLVLDLLVLGSFIFHLLELFEDLQYGDIDCCELLWLLPAAAAWPVALARSW